MQIRLTTSKLAQLKTPLLVIPLTRLSLKDPLFNALDKTLGGRLFKLARGEGFKAKPGQVLSASGAGRLAADRIILIGLGTNLGGKPAYRLRTAAAQAGRFARSRSLKRFAIALPLLDGIDDVDRVRWLAEGAQLGVYGYSMKTGKSAPKPPPGICQLVQSSDGSRNKATLPKTWRAALVTAEANTRGVALARDLVNAPPNELGPIALAESAKALATRHGLKAKVLGRKEIERQGMGLLMAVSQGSQSEPRFVHLHYKPPKDVQSKGCIALVGKGITFDSGGLSLKPPASQVDMKSDMGGAATVLGILEAAASRKLPWDLHGVIPICENMPSGSATRPGDVVGSLSGKTVEINNTDAEGRLILADGLSFAQELQPDLTIDFATLTGAIMVALGPYTAGLFSDHEEWAERLLSAGKRAGEDLWQMPMTGALKEQLNSDLADLRNTGTRWGGAITAALFLKEFAGSKPWIHLDIAGPAFLDKVHGFHPKGGTGFGVLSVLELLEQD